MAEKQKLTKGTIALYILIPLVALFGYYLVGQVIPAAKKARQEEVMKEGSERRHIAQ